MVSFLSLPPEIRNQIYELTVDVHFYSPPDAGCHLKLYPCMFGMLRLNRPLAHVYTALARSVKPPRILEVSRQVRAEALEVFYSLNEFCFISGEVSDMLWWLLEVVDRKHLRHLRRLRYEYPRVTDEPSRDWPLFAMLETMKLTGHLAMCNLTLDFELFHPHHPGRWAAAHCSCAARWAARRLVEDGVAVGLTKDGRFADFERALYILVGEWENMAYDRATRGTCLGCGKFGIWQDVKSIYYNTLWYR